jgi:transcription antitermination factor NusA-like protein
VTAEVHAPRWLHRFIIGQKGKNINSITQDLPKVHVEFSSDADEIQLEGPPEEVEQAKTALERFTKELTDTMSFAVIDIDQKFHRHIIGKSGGNVNRIKQRTGTSITIPGDNSSIRIEGTHKGVADAKKELLEMAAKLENERSKDVKIEHRFHKQIIGSQGQHIREVRERFPGVQITFPDPKSQIDMVNLRGPKDMVDKCAAYLKKQNDEMVAENFVAEVRVFKEFHKNIIGRGGGTIRKIRDETKTKIDLPTENSNSDVIVITGRKPNVEEAKKRIEAIQNELANVTSVEVSIPAKLHQAVIGPKGQLVHSISTECGNVLIRFPSGKAAEGDKDKVTIRGPKGDVEKAKKQLMELANEQALHNRSTEVRAKPEFHRFIIGRQGANIQKIREETGARIVFPGEKDEDKSLVTVIGSQEAITKAKTRLEKIIADLENSVEVEVSVPTIHHRHFIQRRGQVLQDIAADCGGVIISFPRGSSPSERVVVKGAKDCVELAKQRIAEEVENLESQVTLDCVIPHKHHRTVMGPKGHNVQQITGDFNVGVKFPERSEDKSAVSDDGVTPLSDIIKIHGRREQAEEAREALLALVPVTKELSIPFDYHRFIIGAKGKDVRAMMDKYNVRIAIPQPDKRSDTVSVSGVPSHVEDACKALLCRVKELDAQREDMVSEVNIPICL